jgi:hypothetical protein
LSRCAVVLSAVMVTCAFTPLGAADGSAAPGIVFVGPTVRPLPTELEFLSTDSHMTIGPNCYTGVFPGPVEPCQPYLLAREGPSADGLYRFRWNLPTAEAGEVHIEVRSATPDPLDGDRLNLTLTATTSGIPFGDGRTCLMPGGGQPGEGQVAFELGYYSRFNSTAVVFHQERTGGRWAPLRMKALANYRVGGERSFNHYTRRTLRLRVDAEDLRKRKVRLRYFLMKGDHPLLHPKQRARALARSTPFSNAPCLPPGGI